MCGILGVIGQVDEVSFLQALNLLQHRGPDSIGQLHKGNFHLGFRRLSIIDLSEDANQPMLTSDGRYAIIFNGEIYNFKEIREELSQSGIRFATSGDSEVVLLAFQNWGADCLQKFNGMFSFAIFDFQEEEVFLARDRLGIKPLFYTFKEGNFSFASEPKSLLSLGSNDYQLNIESVISYLFFRYPIDDSSFFVGIESLPKGSWMRVKNNSIVQIEKYWSLKDALTKPAVESEEEAITEVRRLLERSVSMRMLSDVPVGAYLSGGLDSSIIVSIMSEISHTKVPTFSIGFEEEGFNEFYFSRQVASMNETTHTEILLHSDEYLDSLEELIRIKDAPLGVPNEVPLYLMSKRLKEDITVVLSGEGADEIFGGYGRIFRSADDIPLIQDWEERGFPIETNLDLKLKERYGKSFPNFIEVFLHLYRYNSLEIIEDLVGTDLLQNFLSGPSISKFYDSFQECDELDDSSKMMFVFENLHLPGLLQRLDSTTMGASVEGRVPFVDHELVEYAFRIPPSFKMRWKDKPVEKIIGAESSEEFDITKWILKEAFQEKLPDEIVTRKKIGFPVPLQTWFGSGAIDIAEEKILNGKLVQSGLFRSEGIKNIIDQERKSGSVSMLIWMLMNLEIFIDSHPELKIPT